MRPAGKAVSGYGRCIDVRFRAEYTSESAHTRLVARHRDREGGIKVDSEQFFITLVTDGVPGQEANARLIAAAPTLLEILALFVDCYPDQIEPLQDRARYIIAKVQGETND